MARRHQYNQASIRVAPMRTIEQLAGRIEAAYGRRRPDFRPNCSSDRLWLAAASTLYQACQDDPALPLDPELYVASQRVEPRWGDAWAELVGQVPARRYRRRVHRIIISLRAELNREVRKAEVRVRRGASVETVLLPSNRALSPLGCFIVAQRAGRDDLAGRFRHLAEDQHRSCPLYRHACRALLPGDLYPRATTPARSAAWIDTELDLAHVELN